MMARKIGRYELVSELGASPLGALWRARHDEGEVLVRLTRVRPPLGQGDADRIVEAARIAIGLEHPRVAAVVDVLTEAGQIAIVQAAPPGLILSTFQKKAVLQRKPVPSRVVLRVALDLCEGLVFVHEQAGELPVTRVHGGVSPDSAIIGDDGVTRVLDVFGAAAGTAEPWVHAARRASYQSPEHVRGKPLSPASDVFSIATIAWELLARRPLFGGATYTEVRIRVLEPVKRADAVRAVGGETVPAELADVLARALRPEAADRHATPGDLAAALQATGIAPATHREVADLLTTLAEGPSLAARVGPASIRPPRLDATAGAPASASAADPEARPSTPSGRPTTPFVSAASKLSPDESLELILDDMPAAPKPPPAPPAKAKVPGASPAVGLPAVRARASRSLDTDGPAVSPVGAPRLPSIVKARAPEPPGSDDIDVSMEDGEVSLREVLSLRDFLPTSTPSPDAGPAFADAAAPAKAASAIDTVKVGRVASVADAAKTVEAAQAIAAASVVATAKVVETASVTDAAPATEIASVADLAKVLAPATDAAVDAAAEPVTLNRATDVDAAAEPVTLNRTTEVDATAQGGETGTVTGAAEAEAGETGTVTGATRVDETAKVDGADAAPGAATVTGPEEVPEAPGSDRAPPSAPAVNLDSLTDAYDPEPPPPPQSRRAQPLGAAPATAPVMASVPPPVQEPGPPAKKGNGTLLLVAAVLVLGLGGAALSVALESEPSAPASAEATVVPAPTAAARAPAPAPTPAPAPAPAPSASAEAPPAESAAAPAASAPPAATAPVAAAAPASPASRPAPGPARPKAPAGGAKPAGKFIPSGI